MLSQSPIVIIQIARMGDLIQSLPLIQALSLQNPVHLVCDLQVREWADCLPGVEKVHAIDTQAWRREFRQTNFDLPSALARLQSEVQDLVKLSAARVISLNEHPICDLLAHLICGSNFQRYYNMHLVIMRSYLRLIVNNRCWSSVHLADVWQMVAGNKPISSSTFKPTARGTQFAKELLQPLLRSGNERIWAIILGSGGKYRRMEPEIFSGSFHKIPKEIRPGLVLIGGQTELDLAARFMASANIGDSRIVNLVGKCAPAELLGVFSLMNLVMGVDTGPLHWAAALGTPVLGFYFGDAGFQETGPNGSNHLVLAPDCTDYPCHPEVAVRCGYRCRQQLQDVSGLGVFFSSLLSADDNRSLSPPAGFRLYRSATIDNVQGFIDVLGSADPASILVWNRLVRAVMSRLHQFVSLNSSFKLMDEKLDTFQEDFFSNFSDNAQIESISELFTRWLNEVVQLPPAVGIPPRIQEAVKRDAVARISEIRCEFSSAMMTTFETAC